MAKQQKPQMHPVTEEYLNILDDCYELYLSKGNDYALDEDPLAGCRASESLGIPAWKWCLGEVLTKQRRLNNAAQGTTLNHESVEDTIKDQINYLTYALILYREAHE